MFPPRRRRKRSETRAIWTRYYAFSHSASSILSFAGLLFRALLHARGITARDSLETIVDDVSGSDPRRVDETNKLSNASRFPSLEYETSFILWKDVSSRSCSRYAGEISNSSTMDRVNLRRDSRRIRKDRSIC